MKQHLSVLLFYVRSSFYKILAVLLGLAAVDSALFFGAWKRLWAQYLAGEIRVVTAEVILEETPLYTVFMVTVILVGILLTRTGRRKGGYQEYTLYRLSITPRSVFLWKAIYNCCIFFLLWAVQAVVAVGLCMYFVRTAESSMVTNQSMFLAFYRNAFLHGLIPLEDTLCWGRNVLFFLMLGILTTYQAYCSLNGKKSGWLLLYVSSVCFLQFPVNIQMPSGSAIEIVIYLILIGIVSYFILVKGEWTLDESGRKA